jgi:hypothetical protein
LSDLARSGSLRLESGDQFVIRGGAAEQRQTWGRVNALEQAQARWPID